jgi:hypothetical protein
MAIELLIEIEAPIILQAVQSGLAVGPGIPAGGTTGQQVIKSSNDDYDTEWSDAGAGDMIKAAYDPTGVHGDAFYMGNMIEVPPTVVNVAAYTVLETDRILHVAYTLSDPCVVTIPTALITTKFRLLIKDGGLNATTNNITIVGEGGETIDGDSSWIINGDGDWLRLYSDGANLFIHG